MKLDDGRACLLAAIGCFAVAGATDECANLRLTCSSTTKVAPLVRIDRRLVAFSLLASLTTACSGGTGAGPGAAQLLPTSVSNSASSATALAVDSVPQTALDGVMVSVHLPLRNTNDLDALIARQGDRTSSDYHHFLTPQQFRESYGPSASDMASVVSTLRGFGFQTKVTSQSAIAAAPQATVERVFGVKLHASQATTMGRLRASQSTRAALAADKAPTLPDALSRAHATVAFSALQRHVDSQRVSKAAYVPDNRYSTTGPYWFDDLKQAYGYPSTRVANGAGRTIAIVIDSDVQDSDTAAYFGHEKALPPVVARRPVDGGPGAFDPNSGESDEASLDVQQSGGSAPGAKIVIYGIPSLTDQYVADAYQAIVDDNTVDIVNSSFGLCELYYTAAYNGGVDFTSILTTQHDIFRQGNAQGITFVASSGDSGSYDCVDPTDSFYVQGVENPADDTAVTGVGGTNLVTKSDPSSLTSAYVRESEFFDTFAGGVPNNIWGSGGGISTIFPKPWYQGLVRTGAATRTVPDIAMHMGGCPLGSVTPCNPDDSSVVTAIGGQFYLLIGTSASSPEFAGLLAVTEQTVGTRLGNANGYIYSLAAVAPSTFYRRGIPGNNGYATTSGYDYVLGNGTPKAEAFALAFGAPRASVPQTRSNP